MCEKSMKEEKRILKEAKRKQKDLDNIKKAYSKYCRLIGEENAINCFETLFDNGIESNKMTEIEAIEVARMLGFEYTYLPFRS